MLEVDLFAIFLEPLSRSGIGYMVTGSVAAMCYGRPRMTHDIDLVVQLSVPEGVKLECLYPAGSFYCPPIESIRAELGRETRGHFNVIHLPTGFKADFYPVGHDVFMDWAMRRRQVMTLGSLQIWAAPIEYIVIQKLRYFQEGASSKHIADIQAMLELSAAQMDIEIISRYVKQFALENEWKQVRH